MGRGERALEISDGGAGAFVGAVFDLDDEGFAAPAVLRGLAGIPEAVGGGVIKTVPEDLLGRACSPGAPQRLSGFSLRSERPKRPHACGSNRNLPGKKKLAQVIDVTD